MTPYFDVMRLARRYVQEVSFFSGPFGPTAEHYVKDSVNGPHFKCNFDILIFEKNPYREHPLSHPVPLRRLVPKHRTR